MTKRIKNAPAVKPSKPCPDFPLFAHNNGQWGKKIRGRLYYFGLWDDPDAALQRYLDQKDDLHAGRPPRPKCAGMHIRDLVNRFLASKRHLVDTSEIVPRTWQDYYVVCQRVVRVFGGDRLVDDLAADNFERLRADFAKTHGPVSLANDIQRVRILFKYAFDNGLMERPVRYGAGFRKPGRETLRLARAKNGSRMFQANEIRRLIGAAGVPLKAMILLGINAGFGNQDCATLPLKALDLETGWIAYHRPKTGVARRVPLWPETMAAIREALQRRRQPKDETAESLVFVTARGQGWAKSQADNPITKEMVKLLKRLDLQRPGRAFYGLRHTFATIASDSRDQVAANCIMGHSPDSSDLGAVYRERISDERLRAVTDHVRKWLFGASVDGKEGQ